MAAVKKKRKVKKQNVKKGIMDNIYENLRLILFILVFASFFALIAYAVNVYSSKKSGDEMKMYNELTSKVSLVEAKITQLNTQMETLKVEVKTSSIRIKGKKITKRVKELMVPAASKKEIKRITIQDAKELYESGVALFIDTRNKSMYDQAHIRKSISLSVREVNNIPKMDSILKDKVLITYCHGIGCHISDKVAYRLYDGGYKNVVIFFGGWNEWNAKKYAITKGKTK